MTYKSETVSKKPGRSPAFPIGAHVQVRENWGGLVDTRRGEQNKLYARIGAMAICPDGRLNPRHHWFANAKRARQAVMVELGRIAKRYGAETAVRCTCVICQMISRMAD